MTIADLLSIVAVILGLAWGLSACKEPPRWMLSVLRVGTVTFLVAALLFLDHGA